MQTLRSAEVEALFTRTVVGAARTSPFQESILNPVTSWLGNERKRTANALAFDSTDGVTPENAHAVCSGIRRTAKQLGHSVRLVVKTDAGETPRTTERKYNDGQSLVVYVKFLGAYVPRERGAVASA